MAHSGYEKLPNHSGMLIGGGFAVAAGGIGLSILLTVGITTKVFLPTGFASLTMGSTTVGVLLLVGRLILRKVAESRLDTIQSTTAIFDEVRAMRDEITAFRRELGAVAEAMAEVQKNAARMAGRQDEILATLSEQAQRFDNAIARLASAIDNALAAQVQQQHTQRRGRRRKQSEGESTGGNVVKLPSQETMRAARGLAARIVRDQKRRSEDRTEDN